jgi:DnaK suppressor protein
VMKALRSNLRWVDRALTKMELGTYGTCERCGNQIGIERLEALPWAILCIECKQKGEGR